MALGVVDGRFDLGDVARIGRLNLEAAAEGVDDHLEAHFLHLIDRRLHRLRVSRVGGQMHLQMVILFRLA